MEFRVDKREGLVLPYVYVIQVFHNNDWVDHAGTGSGSASYSVQYPTLEEAEDQMEHLKKIVGNQPKFEAPETSDYPLTEGNYIKLVLLHQFKIVFVFLFVISLISFSAFNAIVSFFAFLAMWATINSLPFKARTKDIFSFSYIKNFNSYTRIENK